MCRIAKNAHFPGWCFFSVACTIPFLLPHGSHTPERKSEPEARRRRRKNTGLVPGSGRRGEMADARDLKSLIPKGVCGFESRRRQTPFPSNCFFSKTPFQEEPEKYRSDQKNSLGLSPPPFILHDGGVHRCSLVPRLTPSLWATIALVLLCFSINGDSIDLLESQTWDYARLDTLPAFCHELKTDTNTESQMPLGMFASWIWSRAFGTGEAAMRSLNLLWAAVILAALARIGRQICIPWLPLLFAIQPFVWFYMNRARTPLMEMAGGTLLLLGTIACLRRKPADVLATVSLCLGALLLGGASMRGFVPLAAVIITLTAQGLWRHLHLPRPGKVSLFATGALIGLLGLYYLLTILREPEGSQLWTVSPANLAFAGYEFLGLQGLGPGRQELRAIMKGLAPSREILPFIPCFLFFLCAYVSIFSAAFKSWLTRDPAPSAESHPFSSSGTLTEDSERISLLRVWVMGISVTLLSALLIFLVSVFSGVPFWGRNLAGAFPFWIVALAVTVHWARQGLWRKTGRLAGTVLLVLLALSSLLIRFGPWHRHDDYRGAVAEAERLSRTGVTVWWVADHSGGSYYGLHFDNNSENQKGQILFAMNECSIPAELPGAIVLSRPDTFDHGNTVGKLLQSGKFAKTKTLQAFEIWEKVSP